MSRYTSASYCFLSLQISGSGLNGGREEGLWWKGLKQWTSSWISASARDITHPSAWRRSLRAPPPNESKQITFYRLQLYKSLQSCSRNGFHFHHLSLCYNHNPIHGLVPRHFFCPCQTVIRVSLRLLTLSESESWFTVPLVLVQSRFHWVRTEVLDKSDLLKT